MASLWPDMPDDQRELWVGMPEARKADAVARLGALLDLEGVDGGPPRHDALGDAIAASGVSRSGFYAMMKRWRSDPSLDALGVNVSTDGPGRAAQAAQRDRMLAEVRAMLGERPDIGNAEVRRRLGEAFGRIPAFATVRRLVADAQRASPPNAPFGRRVVLDGAGLDVHYDEGIPVRLYALLDVGTDLVLGWSVWSHGDPVGGYVRAISHAFRDRRGAEGRDPGGLGLSGLDLGDVAAVAPASVEVHVMPNDAAVAGPLVATDAMSLVEDRSLGRLIVNAVGERIGPVWIGTGFRESGRSYRMGRAEEMPTLTPALQSRIDGFLDEHNLGRLSLAKEGAADMSADEAVAGLRRLLLPIADGLSAQGY